ANAGSEAVLRQAATAANKPVTAFETVDDQLGFLDSTPENEQISGLLTALTEMDQARTMFDTLVTQWAAGDPDAAGAIMNESLASTPETGRIMLTDRNRRWADTLQARMAQPGTIFVAVGAGHLMGNNSVQHFLAERGLTATRVNY
nr:TraB/GumN family protein [Sphingopyxis sp.]